MFTKEDWTRLGTLPENMEIEKCLLTILIICMSENLTNAQCYTDSIMGTNPGSIDLVQNDFSMREMLGSVLDLLMTAKAEGFVKLNDNHVRTSPGDMMCSIVGEGVDIQALQDYNKTFHLPILTSARLIGKKIMIRGRQRSTLLEQKLMSTLLLSVNIENHINFDGHQSISFVNEGGRRMLTNFNPNVPNIC